MEAEPAFARRIRNTIPDNDRGRTILLIDCLPCSLHANYACS